MIAADVRQGGAGLECPLPAPAAARPTGTRLLHLDACKGILITLVLFGHSIQYFAYASSGQFWSDPVFKLIYMFHMPLFAAYSGYFSPSRAVAQMDVRKRVKTLIAPMILWVVLGYLTHVAITGDMSRPVSNIVSGVIGRYWFIWAIFFSLAACWICESVLRRPRLGYAAIFLVFVLQSSGSDNIAKYGFIFPYFVAGRLIRTKPGIAAFVGANKGIIFTFSAVGAALTYRYWTFDTYIYNNHFQTLAAPASVGLMMVGSACATVCATITINWVARRIVDRPPGRMLQRIGMVTMEIYLVQSIFFAEAPRIAKPFLGADAPALSTRLAIATAACAICLVFTMSVIILTRRSQEVSKLLWGR